MLILCNIKMKMKMNNFNFILQEERLNKKTKLKECHSKMTMQID